MIAFRNSFKPNRGNVPAYDADGNVISLKTATGTWQITYNGANRPVTWVKSTGEKIFMMYDSLGRRFEKRVLNAAGRRILRERYVYAGYNCVQILNGDDGNAVEKEFVWDPTGPTGTRPLTWTFVKRGLNLFYAHDGNKNVSDVFFLALQNGVAAHYEYAPFGAITYTSKNTPYTIDLIAANPFRFSSEFYDPELDLIYYNYRHYSPSLGRWLSRDPIEEKGGLNLYAFCKNNGINIWDFLGEKCCLITVHPNWFRGDEKSPGGHSIFSCGDGNAISGTVYISYFPGDNPNGRDEKNDIKRDFNKYGLDLKNLPVDGGTQRTEKGFDISIVCFSTDCVDSQKVAEYYRSVFRAGLCAPWSLGNNCANNAAAAIASGLPAQEKPKCKCCEEVRDLLLTDVGLALPTDLEDKTSKLKKNGCKRYVCQKRPPQPHNY